MSHQYKQYLGIGLTSVVLGAVVSFALFIHKSPGLPPPEAVNMRFAELMAQQEREDRADMAGPCKESILKATRSGLVVQCHNGRYWKATEWAANTGTETAEKQGKGKYGNHG